MDLGTLGPYAAGLSGALFAALGLAVVLVRPRRAHSVAFGAFALLWGLEITFANLTRVAGPSRLFTLLFLAFLVVLPVPLAYFAAVFGRRGFLARSWWGVALLLAPSAFGAVALAVAPHWFHQGTDADGRDAWGPLFPVYATLFLATFAWTVAAMHARYREARTGVEAERTLLAMLALSIFLGYASFESILLFGLPLAQDGFDASSAAFLAVGLAGAAILARVGADLARRPRVMRPSAAVLALAAPALFGAVSGLTLALPSLPDVETLGLFRAASVALIAYAILRFELFDVDVRIKRGVLAAGVLAGAAVAAVALEQALERALGSTGLAITLTQVALVGGVVLAIARVPRLSRALGERVLPSLQAPERLDARRLEVYEAALAHAGSEDDAFLRDLRARLGVSDSEHALLARLVQRAPPAEPAAPEAGALVAGRYRLERALGEGAAATAWLARDETLQRRVVLKAAHASLARSEAAARAFLHEARVAASLDHPNVVRVFDFGRAADAPFLVMELVEGGTLEERLARGPLPPREARRVAVDVLRGLAHVHAHGVLHRDLKPANVLLAADGAAKISDFGVALAGGVDDTATGLAPPPPKGTLATMSPEVVRGLAPTPRSDVYAVGAILYRCVAGQPYLRLEGRSREAARAAVLAEPPLPAPPGVDAELLAVALRALEKDPARRFADAGEMLGAIPGAAVAVGA